MKYVLLKVPAVIHMLLPGAVLSACTAGAPHASTTAATQRRSEPHTPTVLVLPEGPEIAKTPSSGEAADRSSREAARGGGRSVKDERVASTRTRIEACRGANGKVRVHVFDEGGKLKFRVEPGASLGALDPSQRRCLTDALATLEDA